MLFLQYFPIDETSSTSDQVVADDLNADTNDNDIVTDEDYSIGDRVVVGDVAYTIISVDIDEILEEYHIDEKSSIKNK